LTNGSLDLVAYTNLNCQLCLLLEIGEEPSIPPDQTWYLCSQPRFAKAASQTLRLRSPELAAEISDFETFAILRRNTTMPNKPGVFTLDVLAATMGAVPWIIPEGAILAHGIGKGGLQNMICSPGTTDSNVV
jgi:hypothetical protein